MAAYGSGAVARSIRDEAVVMNVDVGGGTSKIAVCADGKVIDLTALDVGARLVCLEPDGRIMRVEDAGRRFGAELGIDLQVGGMLTLDQGRAIAALMADKLFEAMRGGAPTAQGVSLLRIDPLAQRRPIDADPVFRRRLRIHLRQREQEIRRPRPAARRRNPRARREFLPAAGALDRRHPRHRGRRLAIHHPAQRQHDLCGAARCRAAAQRAGDRAGAAARSATPSIRRRSRARCRPCSSGSISPTASSRSRCSCPGRARRRSSGSTRSAAAWSTGCRACWRAAIRWCWPATATSAACSAFTCTRR